MKSENIVKKSSLLFIMAAAVSCNLLDKAPESTLTPEQYLSTEAGVASFATDRYQELPSHGEYSYGTFETDKNTDNMAHVYPSDMYAPGYWKVEQTGGDTISPTYTSATGSLTTCSLCSRRGR